MVNHRSPPQLPPGEEASLLSTISQSLSFHASPQSFLSTRQLTTIATSVAPVSRVVRAKILNRDVAVITSYRYCEDVLNAADDESQSTVRPLHEGESIGPSTFGAYPAYRELMVDFFPAPNLLLLDFPEHRPRRQRWDEHMSSFCNAASNTIRDIASQEVSTWADGSTIGIYKKMKDLSWEILLAIFLRLHSGDSAYDNVVCLQEDLLRGQFSLFPVSISTPFWRSARSKGIHARKNLQGIMKERASVQHSGCPFMNSNAVDGEDLASNTLLFTSSLAVKSLASLLTASLLNIYLFPSAPSLATRIREQEPTTRDLLLRSILLETERLSPPVVGVMRRAKQDIVLDDPDDLANEDKPSPTLIPAGWDVWLYFVSAARDNSIYESADKFVPERFRSNERSNNNQRLGFAFGSGPKSCLGAELTRQIVQIVTKMILDTGISLEGSVEAKGVRGWLGWDQNVSVESVAKDLKQLPSQRPREPVKLRVLRHG